MNRLLLAALAAMSLSGCASIVSGTNQSVSVDVRSQTAAVQGANCKLSNNKGTWFVTAPGSTVVNRSFEDLSVRCEKELHEPGMVTAKSSTKGMAFGNILFGGFIGAGVDMSTGAAYDYPNLITVVMGKSSTLPETPATALPAGTTTTTTSATDTTATAGPVRK